LRANVIELFAYITISTATFIACCIRMSDDSGINVLLINIFLLRYYKYSIIYT
jgi:hypothetical protein